ncbi:TPA: type 1 fimbrial protein [Proteus mirabilis]|uniref:fimbrial protein n=1 Tax=Proteus mirabilis TaxID=584 RepID=UPI000666C6A8|nr:type 1 fimbrial protein [Proteus mirabilis]MBI6334074.1 type 1 fimbrial protein [Proteus mirabilis]MDM3726584.1 type 1 fimbrial protein [Proteus mirabilis]HCR3470613.1 type 1 fimbrial protein [Proteus mirabilis]HCT9181932.1 type 1 fimbrial protein [Proteus mirabilis]HCT9195909.1 type 1 fimbrial protein [Proteus mirabilis]
MQTKKVSILIVSLCLLLTSWASVAAQSVKYNFSVVFLAKTCEIVVPDNITFTSGEGASSVSANDIKNNKISQQIPISLTNCSTSSLSGTSVYISQGVTLTGTRDFFNNNVSGSFGVQLTDDSGSKTYKVNNSSVFKPSDDSVVWDNITSESSTKSLTAKLRCQKEGCAPEVGPFTATVVLSFFSD